MWTKALGKLYSQEEKNKIENKVKELLENKLKAGTHNNNCGSGIENSSNTVYVG
jgi:hypothetical protein